MARQRYAADLKLTRLLRAGRGGGLYRLVGSCLRCGKCCETPTIRIFPLLFFLKSLRRLIIAWQRHINGFEFLRASRREKCLVFRCSHWDPATKLCDSYSSRPGICRDYPQNQLDFPVPVFFDGCGFKALLRNAETFESSLASLDLPPETLQKLKHDLQLDPEDPSITQ